MKLGFRRLALVLGLVAGLGGSALFTGCSGLRSAKQEPVLYVPAELALPGTMVVYMPKIVSASKQQSGDPVYTNWANALMAYVDESTFVQSILDRGRFLDSSTHISSKTIPSSDYSILLVGARGRAVHVQEPWQSVALFLLLDEYLRGGGAAKKLPPGCEAVTLKVKSAAPEEGAETTGDKERSAPAEGETTPKSTPSAPQN